MTQPAICIGLYELERILCALCVHPGKLLDDVIGQSPCCHDLNKKHSSSVTLLLMMKNRYCTTIQRNENRGLVLSRSTSKPLSFEVVLDGSFTFTQKNAVVHMIGF